MKPVSRMGLFAQFVGRCDQCEMTIEVGDRIGGAPGSGYSHWDCLDLEDNEERSGSDRFEEKPTKFKGTSLEDMGF